MNRRLLGVLVVASVTLLAIAAGAYAGRQETTTTLTMWSYDNQDPGLEPVLGQLSKDFEKSHPGVKINLVFKDFDSLVAIVPRALAVRRRPRRDGGEPGLPDRRAAREGEADPPAHEVRQEVPLGQAVRAVHLGHVPLDARRQVVRQGPGLGHRADRPERRGLLQQEEVPAGRARSRTSGRRRTRHSRRCSRPCTRSFRTATP